jgi:hypothetical protein
MKKWITISIIAVFVLIAITFFACNRSGKLPSDLAVKIISPTSGQVLALNNEVVVQSVIPAGMKWSRL